MREYLFHFLTTSSFNIGNLSIKFLSLPAGSSIQIKSIYLLMKNAQLTPSTSYCDRCSVVYDQMRVKYMSANCNDLPQRAEQSIAEEQITRIFDPSCHGADQDTCTRCSLIVNKQRVWWIKVPGKGCSDSSDDLPKKSDGSVDESKILRKADPSCIATTPSSPGVCDRCSTAYDQMRVKYFSNNCSLLPVREDGSVAEEKITRVFDQSCHNANQVTCTRCSTLVPGQRVWWKQIGTDCNTVPSTQDQILRTSDVSCTIQ
jgi:hypothetical protein